MALTALELRRAFTDFFVERGHKPYPSMPLIPHHPKAPMFANAGMNQFLPIILGEEPIPNPPRATSIQKCVRVKGKHDDINTVGTDGSHLSFFEMLGNFSFGDYFKDKAIAYAWELLTEVYGLDGDRLWITVHDTDDPAEEIWRDQIGVPMERIQRMGEDNFWDMGQAGPAGPDSEIYYDMGPEYGDAGGPAHGSEARYLEIWNLVFMQYNLGDDGSLSELPNKIIDTGAGLERNLAVLQGVDSAFDTDELRRIVEVAERTTGRRYGADAKDDVVLRVLADHARSATFLINDGVWPSNEDRGYVLRRIMRRAIRQAYGIGVESLVLPAMAEGAIEVSGAAYPELVKNRDFILDIVTREEERFRQTLKTGSTMLDTALSGGSEDLPGDVAFKLHDTYGFPLELTLEIAAERGRSVDVAGFDAAMADQRTRARAARAGVGPGGARSDAYKELIDQFGPTEFTGYVEHESAARVLAVNEAGGGMELFLDRTPFYAEAGGQVGDTGLIRTDTGVARVLDTTYAAPGLYRHSVELVEGHLLPAQEAQATVDVERRSSIRRNHSATHLLHWAFRTVLGTHVHQHGSLVAPERLRFDFSHFSQVGPDELAEVQRLANAEVLANDPVRAYETTQDEARKLGAMALFGEKYGDVVRVVEAGQHSIELCGGTHVGATGAVGPIRLLSEGSIGSNLRRVEALTGVASLERFTADEQVLAQIAKTLRVTPAEVVEAVEKLHNEYRALQDQFAASRKQSAVGRSRELAETAVDGLVVANVTPMDRDDVRNLALAVRDLPGIRAVVLGSAPAAGGVALVAAVTPDSGLNAGELLAGPAKVVGGGAGRNPDVSVAGGRDPSKLDDALRLVRPASA